MAPPQRTILRRRPLAAITGLLTSLSPLMTIWYITIFSLLTVSSSLEHNFSPNCGDQMHKEIACSVQIVDCSEDVMAFLPNGSPIPDEAHDLRIENHIIRLSKSIDGRSNYQLKVDVSWQMPPTNSTALLKAFLLLISEKNGRHETCVFFNVSTTEWTVDAITSSPRFHISTNTMFNFGKQYTVELISLPETAAVTSKVKKQAIMPEYPEPPLRPNCTGYSDPAASKWIAAFKKIKVQQVAKTIQIQFATAPEHFCFEAYEVRLLDDDNNEESSYVININDVNHMKVDMVDNKTEYYGEYNFTNLKAEKWYTPQVIPIERASDGRCLCPVNGGDPYAPHIVCSCVAADAKKVMLPKILPPTAPTVEKPNSNVTINHSAPQNNWMFLFVALLILLLLVLFCIIYVIVKIYRRAQQRGKTLRIRFVHDMNSTENGLNGHMNGSVSHTPLISSHAPTNVLIIYSHDCGAHEAAVVSLAEYLRDVFDIEVHIDQWDQDDIDRNLMDYVSSSILKADKVIIINSIGAYQRYTAKIGQEIRIERTQPGTFDNMFVTQIDQTLQHPQIISVRFVYSGFSDVLPPLTGALQYVLPENLPPLLTAILNTPLKTDPRLAGHNPSLSRLQAAITRMDHLRRSDTHWFVNTHHRVLLNTRRPIKIEEVVKNDDEKETEEEMAPLVAERVPEPEPEELEDEAGPSEETVELEPIVADVAVPPQPVLVRSGEDSPVLDSGFISDVLLTEEIGPARIQNNHPLKPIQVKPVNNNHRFIEDKLERSNDSGDSGVISDAEIRTLS